MTITIRDELGYLDLEVDGFGISFVNGVAIFTDLNDEYHAIPANRIEEIH